MRQNIEIDINYLDQQFAACLKKHIVYGGDDLARLNGFADEQLSYTDFIDNFIDKNIVADASIDPSSNVLHKDVCNLQTEMSKPHAKLIAANKIFFDLRKLHGLKVAEEWLDGEYNGFFYLHDFHTSTMVPYCYAYDLERLAKEGLFFIKDHFHAEPPAHLITWTDFVCEYVGWNCKRTSGACGLPNFLIYSYYFWKKDVENGYYFSSRSPEYYRDQEFQRIIYKLNQPYLRGDQPAFTNFTIFDENYLVELFGGKQFPDGSYMVDYIDEIKEYQLEFMRVLGNIRAQCAMTYPVMTYSLLYKNGKFVDEEYAKRCCRQNMRWADSNFATFDSVHALSNCCRLLSDIKQLGYFNSIGGTALSVGSVKVNTINLARIAYESGGDKKKYLELLKQKSYIALAALDTVRHIIKRNVEKKILNNYGDGLIDMENQYCTVGIIGIYETLEMLDLIRVDEFGYHYYTDEGLEFAVDILKGLQSYIDEWRTEHNITYKVNIEQIPAERAASVLQEKDRHFFPNQKYTLPMYGNQWIPLGIKCTLEEKIRVTAILDQACSGGAIAHINIESPFEDFDEAWEMLNYVARKGCKYFAFNYKISVCETNHSFFGEVCPYCGKPRKTWVLRIVGFLTPFENWSGARKEEGGLRTFFKNRLDPILN